jgi:hypothetical protein
MLGWARQGKDMWGYVKLGLISNTDVELAEVFRKQWGMH